MQRKDRNFAKLSKQPNIPTICSLENNKEEQLANLKKATAGSDHIFAESPEQSELD